ncbi:MAG: hypothetical protein KDA41_12295, partial [Planctomycetales bacterium]|nr:hypothetical protein [Planctomycetales bacterium]
MWVGVALSPLLAASACAQAAPAAPAGDEQPVVSKAAPTVMMLRTEDGKLYPVPDLTLEELSELKELRDSLRAPERPPGYEFREATVQGTAQKDRASLEADFTIKVFDTEFVRVPLRMPDAVKSQITFTGEGEHRLTFDAEAGGYVAWIRAAEPNTEHRIHWKFSDRVDTVRDETRLDLSLPRAATGRITLRVPMANAMLVGNRSDVSVKHDGGATEFVVDQAGGDVQLTWHPPRENKARLPDEFEAVGKILLRVVDGQTRA